MRIVSSLADLNSARRAFPELGFVPTMGFLHEGHLSLVRRARLECGAVAVSIFVNPTQFSPSEDLDRYPRDMPRDLALLQAEEADLVFLPDVETIYPRGFATTIDVGPVATVLEGAARPVHFPGVATVVAKLFNMVRPTRAYFGQKDAQQCIVIRRLVRDLNIPLEVIVAPTVREPDGLAMSSRNAYLTPEQRAAAPVLWRALNAAKSAFESGERDGQALRAAMTHVLTTEPQGNLDYVSVADPDDLTELTTVGVSALASMAVRFGGTRLIDNIVLGGA